jgi:hypothetical protein
MQFQGTFGFRLDPPLWPATRSHASWCERGTNLWGLENFMHGNFTINCQDTQETNLLWNQFVLPILSSVVPMALPIFPLDPDIIIIHDIDDS